MHLIARCGHCHRIAVLEGTKGLNAPRAARSNRSEQRHPDRRSKNGVYPPASRYEYGPERLQQARRTGRQNDSRRTRSSAQIGTYGAWLSVQS